MKTILLSSIALLATAAAPASGAGVRQQASSPGADEPAHQVFKMKLGSVTVTAIGDGVFDLPTDQLLVDAKPGEVAALLSAARQPVVQPTSVNAYLIDTGDRQILIDTGGGSFFGPSLGRFLTGLKEAGYRPEDVDQVLITHLHPDHVGGLVVDGRRTFPNATIGLDAAEQAFWLDRANAASVDASVQATFDAAASSLAPYLQAGKVKAFQRGATIAPGVTALALPGHTRGHTAYRIRSAGKTMLVWGDVMHVPAVQLADPAITIRFDSDRDQAFASRRAIMGEAAAGGYLVAGAHMPFPGIGAIARGATGWTWRPVSGAAMEK